tara:strand:- start:2802 stop:3164 length:363 start_codon:yes stop_codon:yes gene_type:complete
MIVFTTSTGNQNLYFIPRIYLTSGITLTLTDDITLNDATNTSSTFTRQGDYIKGVVAFSNLKEDRFYTLRVKRDSDNEVLYKDKLFVTNQTIDQVNGDLYSINNGEYVEQQTSNNDYIVL